MLIEFKGSSFMLFVVYLYDVNFEVICQVLEDKIVQVFVFLCYVLVVVNIVSIEEEVEWCVINEVIVVIGLCIMGVSGCKILCLKIEIDCVGILLLIEGKEKVFCLVLFEFILLLLVVSQIIKMCLIDQLVCFGQCIYVLYCDFIVINYVSVGVEFIVDGNIYVYGMM